jgi:hypothetical protein
MLDGDTFLSLATGGNRLTLIWFAFRLMLASDPQCALNAAQPAACQPQRDLIIIQERKTK